MTLSGWHCVSKSVDELQSYELSKARQEPVSAKGVLCGVAMILLVV